MGGNLPTSWADHAVGEEKMTDQQRKESDDLSENESNFGDKSRDYGTSSTSTDDASQSGSRQGGSADNDGGTSGDYIGGQSGMGSDLGGGFSDEGKDMGAGRDQTGKRYMGDEGNEPSKSEEKTG
jgi:hypothetical protein